MKFRLLLLAILGLGIYAGYRSLNIAAPFAPSPDDLVEMVFAPNVEAPYLVTRGGDLWQPAENGWTKLPVEVPVNDVYIEYDGTLFAATTDGLLRYRNNTWETVPDVPPTDDLESMHGFLFAMGKEGVARSSESSTEDDSWRRLKMPLPDVPTAGLVMLGDHSHILLNGSLAQTNDMGLSWTIVPPPGEVHLIANDALNNLLVAVEDGIYRWEYQAKTWSMYAPLPENLPVERLTLFNGEVVALANGQLFRLGNRTWSRLIVPGAGYFTTLALHRQSRLWLADATNARLWYSDDGEAWTSIPYRD